MLVRTARRPAGGPTREHLMSQPGAWPTGSRSAARAGRSVAVAAVWGVAAATVLVVAAFTRIGPVIYVIGNGHGVHQGDALVAAVMSGLALLVSVAVLRSGPRVRAQVLIAEPWALPVPRPHVPAHAVRTVHPPQVRPGGRPAPPHRRVQHVPTHQVPARQVPARQVPAHQSDHRCPAPAYRRPRPPAVAPRPAGVPGHPPVRPLAPHRRRPIRPTGPGSPTVVLARPGVGALPT